MVIMGISMMTTDTPVTTTPMMTMDMITVRMTTMKTLSPAGFVCMLKPQAIWLRVGRHV